MSHFSVLVIGNDPETQLAPYQEYDGQESLKHLLVFNDIEDEYLKKYNEKSVTKVIMPDGRMLDTWDDEFKKTDEKNPWDSKAVIPEGLEQREVPYKELFSTFEEYMDVWCGEHRKENGRFGYWNNPNGFWDWNQLGGRWTGFFKMKPGTFGELGEHGIDEIHPKPDEADQAQIEDIDFEAMIKAAEDKARENYRTFKRLLGGEIPKIDRSWESFLEDKTVEDIQARRDAYWAQPALEKMTELRKKDKSFFATSEEHSLIIWSDLSDFQISEEEYVYNAGNSAITTFAVLKDGKWYQRGSMGWWGMVSDEKDKKEWCNQFRTLIDGLPAGTQLSIYDCHI